MSDYPEHDKLKEVSDLSQAIFDFTEWMAEAHGFRICELTRDERWWHPASIPIRDLLAQHFGIDLKALEREKQDILDKIREMQG